MLENVVGKTGIDYFDKQYLDGVFTVGTPCKHAWSYLTGTSKTTAMVQVIAPSGTSPPLFVQNYYYCEIVNLVMLHGIVAM